jgi:hypothetical protein
MKAEFFGTLDASHIEGKWWRILNPGIAFYSEIYDITIYVPPGFVTDFASVPRWPFTYWLAGGTGNWEACIHDLPYRYGLISRWQSDVIFWEAGQLRIKMREKQTLLLNTGRQIRTHGMTLFVVTMGFFSFKSAPGCLDYRKKNLCKKLQRECNDECPNYYPLWESCVMKGYHPDIIEHHQRFKGLYDCSK